MVLASFLSCMFLFVCLFFLALLGSFSPLSCILCACGLFSPWQKWNQKQNWTWNFEKFQIWFGSDPAPAGFLCIFVPVCVLFGVRFCFDLVSFCFHFFFSVFVPLAGAELEIELNFGTLWKVLDLVLTLIPPLFLCCHFLSRGAGIGSTMECGAYFKFLIPFQLRFHFFLTSNMYRCCVLVPISITCPTNHINCIYYSLPTDAKCFLNLNQGYFSS